MSEKIGKIRKVTGVGMGVNVLLSGLKISTGIITRSQALIADGVHSLSDLATDLAIIIGVKYWNSPADEGHPYGHGRLETLINLGIGLALSAVAIGIGWQALVTIGEDKTGKIGLPAFIVAMVSIFLKEGIYRWTASWGRRLRSRAVTANAWHHRSDALSSIPVAVAVLGSYLWPQLSYLDRIAALLVCVLIFKAAWRVSWPNLRELMEVRGDRELEDRILQLGEGMEEIQEIHRIRSRRVGGGYYIDLHMLVAPETTVKSAHKVAGELKARVLAQEEMVIDVLVHIEPLQNHKKT